MHQTRRHRQCHGRAGAGGTPPFSVYLSPVTDADFGDMRPAAAPGQAPGTIMQENDFTRSLLEFLRTSPTPFHAVQNMAACLERRGMTPLYEGDRW